MKNFFEVLFEFIAIVVVRFTIMALIGILLYAVFRNNQKDCLQEVTVMTDGTELLIKGDSLTIDESEGIITIYAYDSTDTKKELITCNSCMLMNKVYKFRHKKEADE